MPKLHLMGKTCCRPKGDTIVISTVLPQARLPPRKLPMSRVEVCENDFLFLFPPIPVESFPFPSIPSPTPRSTSYFTEISVPILFHSHSDSQHTTILECLKAEKCAEWHTFKQVLGLTTLHQQLYSLFFIITNYHYFIISQSNITHVQYVMAHSYCHAIIPISNSH